MIASTSGATQSVSFYYPSIFFFFENSENFCSLISFTWALRRPKGIDWKKVFENSKFLLLKIACKNLRPNGSIYGENLRFLKVKILNFQKLFYQSIPKTLENDIGGSKNFLNFRIFLQFSCKNIIFVKFHTEFNYSSTAQWVVLKKNVFILESCPKFPSKVPYFIDDNNFAWVDYCLSCQRDSGKSS